MDFSFSEFAIIGIVALLVIGPDKLPGLARTAGLWVGKVRGFINSVKTEIDTELKMEEFKNAMSESNQGMHEITEIIKDTRSEFQNSINSIKSPNFDEELEENHGQQPAQDYQVKAIPNDVYDEKEDDAHHNEVEDGFADDYHSDYEVAELDAEDQNQATTNTAPETADETTVTEKKKLKPIAKNLK
ncbi:Twin-arginine translocation protein TatB [hydrothermal vent metagenome]|uniref:Twin-arginine translocation protein TatB n=1 Tax=hydrothermal vent metagenome TaxID=652676 RepID=A0A3B1A5G7_9ZZZZ